MSNSLYRILTNPIASIRETSDPLAKLLRHIFADLDLKPITFNRLLDKYLDDPVNGIKPGDRAKRSSTRGNRIKEITNKKVTWDNFMKAMKILDPESMEVQIALNWGNDRITIHTIVIPMKNQSFEHMETLQTDQANLASSTTVVPPLQQSHWHGVRTSVKSDYKPEHSNITLTFDDSKKEQGDD